MERISLPGARIVLSFVARRSVHGTAMLAFVIGLAACNFDFFGPDTKTGRAIRSGTVTSGIDGSPIEGAKVYWNFPGFIVGSGTPIPPDTAVTDAEGRYHLETKHYCDSQLGARAVGYATVSTNLSYLACPDTQPTVVDIVLQPN